MKVTSPILIDQHWKSWICRNSPETQNASDAFGCVAAQKKSPCSLYFLSEFAANRNLNNGGFKPRPAALADAPGLDGG